MGNKLDQMSAPVAAAAVALAMLGGAGIGLAVADLTDDDAREVVVAGPPDAGTGITQPATTTPYEATPHRQSTPAPDTRAPAPEPAPAPDPDLPAVAREGAPSPVPDASTPPDVGSISADRAGQIAADHVGGGAVQAVEVEDDGGAAWEVDVYTPRGEYEVYVSATGQVVRVLGPFTD